jgi:hypothetical protein
LGLDWNPLKKERLENYDARKERVFGVDVL